MARQNERAGTRFEGVHQRPFANKRWRGKPDVSYEIDYPDPVTGKRVRKMVGRRSEGMTAEAASGIRAEMIARGREQARSGDTYVAPTKPLTLGQAWATYLTDWLQAQGKSTTRDDTYMFERHLRPLAALPLSAISPLELDRLAGDLMALGLSAQSVKHALALLRRIMKRMIKWRLWRGQLPFDDFDMPRVNNARTRILTPYQAQALLEALAITSPRTYQMSLISLHCGLRFGEIAVLTRQDLDFDRMSILIRDPKGGVDRYAIMTPTVATLLRKVCRSAAGVLLVPSRSGGPMAVVSRNFPRTVTALGLNDSSELDANGLPIEIKDNRLRIVFHTWRHTYGSWLAEAGDGQETIADRLGHSSNDMSERYTHVFSGTRRKTAATIEHMFRHGTPPAREDVHLTNEDNYELQPSLP